MTIPAFGELALFGTSQQLCRLYQPRFLADVFSLSTAFCCRAFVWVCLSSASGSVSPLGLSCLSFICIRLFLEPGLIWVSPLSESVPSLRLFRLHLSPIWVRLSSASSISRLLLPLPRVCLSPASVSRLVGPSGTADVSMASLHCITGRSAFQRATGISSSCRLSCCDIVSLVSSVGSLLLAARALFTGRFRPPCQPAVYTRILACALACIPYAARWVPREGGCASLERVRPAQTSSLVLGMSDPHAKFDAAEGETDMRLNSSHIYHWRALTMVLLTGTGCIRGSTSRAWQLTLCTSLLCDHKAAESACSTRAF